MDIREIFSNVYVYQEQFFTEQSRLEFKTHNIRFYEKLSAYKKKYPHLKEILRLGYSEKMGYRLFPVFEPNSLLLPSEKEDLLNSFYLHSLELYPEHEGKDDLFAQIESGSES